MKLIGRILARMRREKFTTNIAREIYHKIFPHMNGHADHGYPFSSDEQLHLIRLKGCNEVRTKLFQLERAALEMPEAECNAFLFIVNRDLQEQIRMYRKFADARKYECESHEPQPAVAAA